MAFIPMLISGFAFWQKTCPLCPLAGLQLVSYSSLFPPLPRALSCAPSTCCRDDHTQEKKKKNICLYFYRYKGICRYEYICSYITCITYIHTYIYYIHTSIISSTRDNHRIFKVTPKIQNEFLTWCCTQECPPFLPDKLEWEKPRRGRGRETCLNTSPATRRTLAAREVTHHPLNE